MIIRLHAKKYGWDERNYFEKIFNKIQIDNGEKNIQKLIEISKLCVFTYNATGYLETLTANIPTVIFWDRNENILRDEAEADINSLKEVKIYFDNFIDAANHINDNWENINKWWKNEKLQKIKNEFCFKYAKKS